MIGTHLEAAGWRQGSIVNDSDLRRLLDHIDTPVEAGMVLLLASQSCDIAHDNIDSDPCLELSIARKIKNYDGNCTHNKNPRILHTQIARRTGNREISTEEYIELKAFEKVAISKMFFQGFRPDPDRVLEKPQLQSYIAWLSARYSRPALPTEFNRRMSDADPKGRLRKIAKRCNEHLMGLYVEITPDTEVQEGEAYNVNLLGLLPSGFDGDRTQIDTAVKNYACILRNAGMEVMHKIQTEDEISMATIKRFKRFYLHDLSFRETAPHPPETTINV